MRASAKALRRDAWGIGAALFYWLLGQAFVPLLGIQNDEALFASPILQPRDGLGMFRLLHTHFALMLMSYLGTLKTLLMLPVLKLFGAGPWSVREPMILAGAVSVWIFYRLLRETVGETAARIGCVLLAADTLYLLTTCFDWGPVALQHLLLIAGMLLSVRFYRQRSPWILATAFFAFGLAMWDKALAVWLLSGMAAAAAAVFPRRILAVITGRRLAIATAGFLAGALPLVIYNIGHHGDTFHGNFVYDGSQLPSKARALMHTADGGILLGYLSRDDGATPHPHSPRGMLQRFSAAVSALAGHPRRDLFPYAVLLAILLIPVARGEHRRAILFAALAMALAWIQMAITADAGGSAHHTILLWPLPEMAVAAALAAAAQHLRRAAAAVFALVAVLCLSSLLVTNEYYSQMVRNGGSTPWTEAVFDLNRSLRTVPADYVFCMDWGYLDSLRLLSMGKLPLREGMSAESPAAMSDLLGDPQHVFVTHSPALAYTKNAANLALFAARTGYSSETVTRIDDAFGQPIFEVYRFRKIPASSPSETRSRP
jgi:4-amino-4-deoxy-L-arabinose transferase-like glycosyltransferase